MRSRFVERLRKGGVSLQIVQEYDYIAKFVILFVLMIYIPDSKHNHVIYNLFKMSSYFEWFKCTIQSIKAVTVCSTSY